MTWLRPLQSGFTPGAGSGLGVGVVFIAKASTQVNVAALVGGAPALVDGVAALLDDVILVRFQAVAPDNGLYRVDVPGPGGTWTRIEALNTGAELNTFALVKVREGMVDMDHEFILATDPPYVIGVTPLAFTLYPPGTAPSTAILAWGNESVSPTTTTRYLTPWYDDDLASVAPVQWTTPRAGTIRRLRVRHNVPLGNGNAIVYTLRVNGVASALSASVASNVANGSDLVNSVAVAVGDLLDIEVTKALAVVTSPTDIAVDAEFV